MLTTVCVKFRPDDLKALEECERLEMLTRSDVVRRAIRAYLEILRKEAERKRKR